jgi:hypothetical protein
MPEVVVDRRYRGPSDSGNGGYTAGLLAGFVGGPAEVTLRVPPPLERTLVVVRRDGGVVLLDGDAVVAEAIPAAVDVQPPAAPTWDEAVAASRSYEGFSEHVFRECFTCGPAREEGDGLRVFAGRVAGREPLVAAPWVAREIAPEIVWAVIDCPGAFAVSLTGRGETVLGRMAAELLRLPREGERCVVVGWPLGADGRKLYAGTALYGDDGELLARARQTWIAPRT